MRLVSSYLPVSSGPAKVMSLVLKKAKKKRAELGFEPRTSYIQNYALKATQSKNSTTELSSRRQKAAISTQGPLDRGSTRRLSIKFDFATNNRRLISGPDAAERRKSEEHGPRHG